MLRYNYLEQLFYQDFLKNCIVHFKQVFFEQYFSLISSNLIIVITHFALQFFMNLLRSTSFYCSVQFLFLLISHPIYFLQHLQVHLLSLPLQVAVVLSLYLQLFDYQQLYYSLSSTSNLQWVYQVQSLHLSFL